MAESVDFKQLLQHAEALSDGDLGGPDGVRLLAYAPALEALYAQYTQSAAHKRVRLHEYKRRMDAVRDAVARSAALQPPCPLPGVPPEAPTATPEPSATSSTASTTTASTRNEKQQKPKPKQKQKQKTKKSRVKAAERQAEREATESEMAAMASMLRQTATRLRDTVRADNRVVDEIADIVDQHTAGTRTQRTKLAQSAPPWWREMLWYIVVCVVAVVVFNVALFLTGLFGRHDAALCRPPHLHLLARSRSL